jgi:hypothetical protein
MIAIERRGAGSDRRAMPRSYSIKMEARVSSRRGEQQVMLTLNETEINGEIPAMFLIVRDRGKLSRDQ